jgi:hypothetical protein
MQLLVLSSFPFAKGVAAIQQEAGIGCELAKT